MNRKQRKLKLMNARKHTGHVVHKPQVKLGGTYKIKRTDMDCGPFEYQFKGKNKPKYVNVKVVGIRSDWVDMVLVEAKSLLGYGHEGINLTPESKTIDFDYCTENFWWVAKTCLLKS